MTNPKKGIIALFLGMSLFLPLGFAALADEVPAKPLTFVISYPAGGSTGVTGRVLVNVAKKHLSQPIICENKPRGGGTVGPALVLAKPPDGYTVGISSGAVTIAWHMGKLNFKCCGWF